MNETYLRAYYACFNERRFSDGEALFAPDAIVEQIPFGRHEKGGAAYRTFAETWIRAFPDALLEIERVTARSQHLLEVDLRASGTHLGPLEIGSFGTFAPTSTKTTLRMRELLDVREGRIVFSGVSLDVQDLIQQLTVIDRETLLRHLDRIGRFREELLRTDGDANRQRDITRELGRELDAARLVVRPYFKR